MAKLTEFLMTLTTNRYNIKPIFWRIAFVVMIFLCLPRAVTASQGVEMQQLASNDSVGNSTICFAAFRIMSKISECAFQICNFTLFCLVIASSGFLIYSFAFFALPISLLTNFGFWCFRELLRVITITYFAITTSASFFGTVFIKIRKGFNFFALRTSFCFNWFRHGFFLTKKLCLEPIAAQYCSRLTLI